MLASQLAQPVVAGSANCLIVDDEPSVRRSLARMLAAQGFNCLEAGTGARLRPVAISHTSPTSASRPVASTISPMRSLTRPWRR